MAMTERARAELYDRLDQTLGRDAADTLMGYLPPVGWADVATKQDLATAEVRLEARIDTLEARIDGRIDRLEAGIGGRIADVEIRFERALRQAVLALVTTMIASVGAAVAITQILTG